MAKGSNVTEEQCDDRQGRVFERIGKLDDKLNLKMDKLIEDVAMIKGAMRQNWLWLPLVCTIIAIIISILSVYVSQRETTKNDNTHTQEEAAGRPARG